MVYDLHTSAYSSSFAINQWLLLLCWSVLGSWSIPFLITSKCIVKLVCKAASLPLCIALLSFLGGSDSCLVPSPPDRPGSWGLPGFCVSARRKMRGKRRDEERAEERGRGVCWHTEWGWRDKDGGEEELQGFWSFSFILSSLLLSFSLAALRKALAFTDTTSLWQPSVFRLQSGNPTPDTPLTVGLPHTPYQL